MGNLKRTVNRKSGEAQEILQQGRRVLPAPKILKWAPAHVTDVDKKEAKEFAYQSILTKESCTGYDFGSIGSSSISVGTGRWRGPKNVRREGENGEARGGSSSCFLLLPPPSLLPPSSSFLLLLLLPFSSFPPPSSSPPRPPPPATRAYTLIEELPNGAKVLLADLKEDTLEAIWECYEGLLPRHRVDYPGGYAEGGRREKEGEGRRRREKGGRREKEGEGGRIEARREEGGRRRERKREERRRKGEGGSISMCFLESGTEIQEPLPPMNSVPLWKKEKKYSRPWSLVP
jgi:hypothetical protein